MKGITRRQSLGIAGLAGAAYVAKPLGILTPAGGGGGAAEPDVAEAASGLYSDESVEGTTGQTWLRGYQVTDSAGLAAFTTIYPGWYNGRTIHIHVRVRVFDGSTATFNYTTQIFFSESDNSAVIATSPYNSRGTSKDTPNASDMIYQQEAQAGNVLLPTLSGNTSRGF